LITSIGVIAFTVPLNVKFFFQSEEEFQHLFLCDILGIFHGSDGHHICDACVQTCPACSSVLGASMFRHSAALGTSQRRYQSNVSVSIVLKSDKSVIIVVYPFKFCEFIVFANYT
jgi:hypothetical protein